MTIKLTAETESTLIMSLAEGLQTVVLNHGFPGMPTLQWVDDLQSNLSADDRSKLDRFCGEPGLKSFVYSEINGDIRKLNKEIDDEKKPLSEVAPFRNSIAYARSLVEKLKKIPQRYRVTVALPTEISDPMMNEIDTDISLGMEIKIVTGDKLPTPFPLTSTHSHVDKFLFRDVIYGTEQPRAVYTDRLYFTMPILGYATVWNASELCRSFEDYLKAFFGAGIAEGLFKHDWFFDQRDRLPYISVHTAGEAVELIGTEVLEKELLQSDVYLATSAFAQKNKEDLWIAYQTVMAKIASVFAETKDARKLFTACIWYYRATTNRRPLDGLLEATIAIEVLLGDRQVSEGIGLSNLLGNRCAFLLGRTSTQRQNILNLFTDIYNLRSKIVHEGRHKLEPGERMTVNAAVSLCGSIISKEMEVRTA